VLTAVNNTTNGGNGLPVIYNNLTIVGNGDTIERSARAPFRLLDVARGGALTLENLTLQGGLALSGANGGGGAIYNQGTLVLNGVTVQGNAAGFQDYFRPNMEAAYGGGIFSLYGSVTLEGGTIVKDNRAGSFNLYSFGGDALGGGLAALGGTVTVTNATLDNNTAQAGHGDELDFPNGNAYGGGLYASGATLHLTNATIDGNTATISYYGGLAYGGGLFLDTNFGTASLTNCAVQGNSASGNAGEGGGIFSGYVAYAFYYAQEYAASYGAGAGHLYLDAATVAQVTGNTASDGAAYDNIVGSYTLT